MSRNQIPTPFPTFWTFLFGATLGAVVVALTTSKSGPKRRRELRDLAHRSRARAHRAIDAFQGAGQRSKRHFAWHVANPKPGLQISVDDLPG